MGGGQSYEVNFTCTIRSNYVSVGREDGFVLRFHYATYHENTTGCRDHPQSTNLREGTLVNILPCIKRPLYQQSYWAIKHKKCIRNIRNVQFVFLDTEMVKYKNHIVAPLS